MELYLRETSVLRLHGNGDLTVLSRSLLPFGLRKENLSFPDYFEWAANRTITSERTNAKSILNALRLSQTNHYAVFRACRGLSLTDAYWVLEEGDDESWDRINLFENPISH